MSKDVGDKILKARLAAGLTQRDLAEKIGVKICTISSYEKDRCDPGKERWDRMADALSLDIETIYRWMCPATKDDGSLKTS